jgi:hypothetical protein
MPSRDRKREKGTNYQTSIKRVTDQPKRRKSSFETEPWYAEAARKLSAAKKSADPRS